MTTLLQEQPHETLTGLLDKLFLEDLGMTNLKDNCGKKALKSLYSIEWEDLRVNERAAMEWAGENRELMEDLRLNGYSQHTCNRTYLYSFYTSLCFHRQLLSIDQRATRLLSLQTLELQNNRIASL